MHRATSNYSIQLQTLFLAHLLSWVRIALDSTIHLNFLLPCFLYKNIYSKMQTKKVYKSQMVCQYIPSGK